MKYHVKMYRRYQDNHHHYQDYHQYARVNYPHH